MCRSRCGQVGRDGGGGGGRGAVIAGRVHGPLNPPNPDTTRETEKPIQ